MKVPELGPEAHRVPFSDEVVASDGTNVVDMDGDVFALSDVNTRAIREFTWFLPGPGHPDYVASENPLDHKPD